MVTGCRLGKRALKFRDWGKMAATFVDLASGRGIRIVALEDSRELAASSIRTSRPKAGSRCWPIANSPTRSFSASSGCGSPSIRRTARLQGRARACPRCGEGVNFGRFAVVDGERLCLPARSRNCATGSRTIRSREPPTPSVPHFCLKTYRCPVLLKSSKARKHERQAKRQSATKIRGRLDRHWNTILLFRSLRRAAGRASYVRAGKPLSSSGDTRNLVKSGVGKL